MSVYKGMFLSAARTVVKKAVMRCSRRSMHKGWVSTDKIYQNGIKV
jgi:hypothetical protein